MQMTDSYDDLIASVQERDLMRTRDILRQLPPSDIADLMSKLAVEDQVLAFRVLPRALATDVFEYMPFEQQEELLKALAREDVAAILNDMAPDDRTRLLDELPASVTKQLLALLTRQERAVATQLLGYPVYSVGR